MNSKEGLKISIAMAVYNGAKNLGQQLDSISNQTRLPDEVIICDDNSADDSLEIVHQFKSESPFDVFIYKNIKNLGYIRNFEQAIEKTSGDIIFLSDQDDVWFPEKIGEIERIFKEKPEVWLVVNDQEFVDENLNPSGISNLKRLRQVGRSESFLKSGCCTSFRKKFKEVVLPISANAKGHDMWMHRIAETLERRYIHPYVLQYYRRHTHAVSHSITKRPAKVGRMEFYFRSLDSKHVESHEAERKILDDMKCRLQTLKLLSKSQQMLLDKKIEAYEARIDLLRSHFISRRIKAVTMLKKGQYKSFRGVKSFLRDFITQM